MGENICKPNSCFVKRRNANDQQVYEKKCPTSLFIRGMQIKTTMNKKKIKKKPTMNIPFRMIILKKRM